MRPGLIAITVVIYFLGMNFLASAAGTQRIFDDNEYYVTRLNYGFVAVKTQQACIADSYWYHTFHLTLPSSNHHFAPWLWQREDLSNCSFNCIEMGGLFRSLRALSTVMRTSIAKMSDQLFALVPDINAPYRKAKSGDRKTRGLVNAVGSISSYLWGLATEGDVQELKAEISRIKALSSGAAADATRLYNKMATFTRLENERLDKMHRMLAEEHKSMTQLYQEVENFQKGGIFTLNAMGRISLELAQFVELHDSIAELQLGVEDLVKGELTPRLLGADQIGDLLTNVSETLRERGFQLCQRTIQEVYASKTYDFARHGRDLFIRIRIPYSRLEILDVYKTQTFLMPVPGNQSFTTQLQGIPRFIVADVRSGHVGELAEAPKFTVIDETEIIWHTASSCIFKLMTDWTSNLNEICQFTARKEIIQQAYHRLIAGVYVLTNFTSVRTRCAREQPEKLIAENCNPCLLHLDCGCSLMTNNGVITSQISGCDDNKTNSASVYYAVNLALLNHFYDLTNVTLNGKGLLNPDEKFNIKPITLPVFGENISSILAADSSISYSLSKIASSINNDSIVFHSSAEALILDLLEGRSQVRDQQSQAFDIDSWAHWTLCVLIITIIGLCVVIVRLKRTSDSHTKTILMLLAGVKGASTLELRPLTPYEAQPTQNNQDSTNGTIIEEVRNLDIAIICLVILIALLILAIVLYIIYKKLSPNSKLCLEIKGVSDLLLILYWTFPDASRNYKVKISGEGLKLLLHNYYLFGLLKVETSKWSIKHSTTNKRLSLPTYILLSPFTTKCLRDILEKGTHVTTPVVVHSHEFVYLNSDLHISSVDKHSHDEIEMCSIHSTQV